MKRILSLLLALFLLLLSGCKEKPDLSELESGSTTILVAKVKKSVTKDEINAYMKSVASDSFGYNEDQIVSSDIIGETHGSIFDATQTMVGEENLVQVVSWYDNENSYTSQMVRTIKCFAELK